MPLPSKPLQLQAERPTHTQPAALELVVVIQPATCSAQGIPIPPAPAPPTPIRHGFAGAWAQWDPSSVLKPKFWLFLSDSMLTQNAESEHD